MTRDEIIDRAMQAFNEAVSRGQSLRADILRQRDASLSAVPAARAALEKHAAALSKAEDDFSRTQSDIQRTLPAAERDAEVALRLAEDHALVTKRSADADALALLRRKTTEAEEDFAQALHGLQQPSTLAARDKATLDAERRRDAAIETARDKHAEAANRNEDTFRTGAADSLVEHTAAVNRARDMAGHAGQAAIDARDAAVVAAAVALQKALGADPVAASINEAFTQQLAIAEAGSEFEKSAIRAQMRLDLAALED
jgi:hypothetical protein